MNVTFGKYPDLENFLSEFTNNITSAIQVQSIILFGGIMLDDFSKRYSDIDIVVVMDKGLRPKTLEAVGEAIKKLYEIDANLARILYVYFIPSYMIESPNEEFKLMDGSILGYENFSYFGKYPLSIMDDFSIREKGKILYGEDLRNHFPEPPKDCFWKMFMDSLPYMEKAVKLYPFQFSTLRNSKTAVNWLLYFPRLIYSLLNEDIIGKSDSAYWFLEEYNGLLGEFLVEVAKCRQEDASVTDTKDLVISSREIFLFSLERAFEVKGIDIPSLKDLVNIEIQRVNFKPVFREIRKLI